VRFLADDAELTATEPFPERGPIRGRQLHEVVRDLSQEARIDVTRKQVTQDRTAWTVRLDAGGTIHRGLAEAEFRHNRLRRLRLGSAPE
jgi:hypothetical protein